MATIVLTGQNTDFFGFRLYRLPYPSGLVQRRGRQERGRVSREPHARDVAAVADELHLEVDPVVQQPPRFHERVVATGRHQQRALFFRRVCARIQR